MTASDSQAPTVAELLRGDEPPRLERELLLAEAVGRPRSWLYAHPKHVPSDESLRRFDALLGRRRQGHPIAHLLGRKPFWSLDLEATPDTLIPRPETELLVEFALEALPPGQPAHVLDLGTGTGAIALAIATERPESSVLGIDASPEAVELADCNAARCGIGNVRFVTGDWYRPVAGRHFDLIVSNPPYVAAGDPLLERGDLRFEPRSALVSGPSGLDDLRRIIGDGPKYLAGGGWLAVEHGHDQQAAVATLFQDAGFASLRRLRDLADKPRVVAGSKACGRPSVPTAAGPRSA